MQKNIYILLSVFFFAISGLTAQRDDLSNLRVKIFKTSDLPAKLDSLSVIPNTVEIYSTSINQKMDTSIFFVKDNRLFLSDSSFLQKNQKIKVKYRVLPYDLRATFSHLDSTIIGRRRKNDFYYYDPYEDQQESILDFKGMKYNGSFSRGISFGNSQSLALNSQFNLQMAGNLGDGMEVLAAITDNNIPIQPDGNTQQLNDFDKVFIQLKKDDNKLIAGDYEIAKPEGYFINYYKKLQGAIFHNKLNLGKGKLTSKGGVAIARGKFSRNNVLPQEGNQGPYKLKGAEGERFIIILSGTEKVYMDGRLLERGLDRDYVIDYNQGEVTFTARQLITKDKRIIVEFEYSDRNYLRSMYVANSVYKSKKWNIFINAYSEQDSKKPLEHEFSESESEILRNSGDNFENAVVRSIDTIEEFTSSRVLYKVIDTVFCSTFDEIFVYSANPDSAKYIPRFSYVGEGNGNYILDTKTGANGRVYKWVEPDCQTGKKSGTYEPVVQLIAPQKHQIFSFGGEYKLSQNSNFHTEIALSNTDKNRLSPIEGSDNTGIAISTGFDKFFNFGKKGWRMNTALEYQFVHENFNELSPYRSPEFSRDWNLISAQSNQSNIQKATENIGSFNIGIKKGSFAGANYEFKGFLRDTFFTGGKHFGNIYYSKNGYKINASGSYLNTKTTLEKTSFFRPKLHFSKVFKKMNGWKLGINLEKEKNNRYLTHGDSLEANSFYYDLAKVYIMSSDTGDFNIKADFVKRRDFSPFGKIFKTATIADELHLQGNWKYSKNSRLNWDFSYRNLKIEDENLTKYDPSETYLSRVNHFLNLFKGAVRSNLSYELGSGQERKIEFTYIEVTPGDGIYQWHDYNNDSIPQINEFEIAVFRDSATYIRSSIYTDDFIRSNFARYNHSVHIDPRAIWHNQKGIKKILSKLSTQSTFQINRKVKKGEGVSPWNPFQLEIPDTSLVSVSSIIRNVIYFNKADPKFDIQIGLTNNRNKVVLTTGYESRHVIEHSLKARWNITRKVSFRVSAASGNRKNDSEFYQEKDYDIKFVNAEPQLSWLPTKNFKAQLSYKFSDDKNLSGSIGETSVQHKLKLDLKFNKSAKTSINMNAQFVSINFTGKTNSPVGFAMLQGLQNGSNYIWNVTIEQKLAKNIRLNIGYDGRQTGKAKVVHLGRAQIAAVF